MKTIQTLFIASLLFSLTANAQITKGYWMVGGSGSFKTTTTETINTGSKSEYTILEISPNIGYFFADKIAGGINTNFYYNPYEGASNIGYGVGPFLKYYFLDTEKLVNVFVEASYLYFENTNKSDVGGFTRSPNNSYGLKAGPVVYFNDSVALELALEYSRVNINKTVIENNFLISVGFQIHLIK